MSAGASLKKMRERLGLTIRKVEQLSEQIVLAAKSQDYFISNGWLTKLEKGRSVPSIHTLFSLSVIYRVAFNELLAIYGVHLNMIGVYAQMMKLTRTHTIPEDFAPGKGRALLTGLHRRGQLAEETNLLQNVIEQSGEVLTPLLHYLNDGHSQYGYIGLGDLRLYPLIQPGSLVLIDQRQNKIVSGKWQTEFDRPIYFLEMKDGFACSWCEMKGNRLTLVPHPLSPCSVECLSHPHEVEIVGRVTGLAMQLNAPVASNVKQRPKATRGRNRVP